MANKVLTVDFKAKDGLSKVMKEQGATADQTARKMKELNTAGTGGDGGEEKKPGGGLKELNNMMGSRRAMARLLSGGIAGFVGKELAAATGQMVELNKEFRQGKLDAMGLGVKIAEGIPIIGGFVTAGQNIREMFTHEQEAIDKINAKSAITNEIIDYTNSLLEKQAKRREAIGDILEAQQQRQGRIGKEGAEAQAYDALVGENAKVKAIQRKREADEDAANKEFKKLNDDIEKKKQEGAFSTDDVRTEKDKAKKQHEKDLKDITIRYANAEFQERYTSGLEIQELQKKQAEQSMKLHEDSQTKISDLKQQARQADLKRQGIDMQAELEQIRFNAEEKKKAIRDAAESQMKAARPEDRKGIADDARKQQQAVEDTAQAEARAAMVKRQDEIRKQQRTERESQLKEQVDFAGTANAKLAAARELEKSKLNAEFEDRQKSLVAMMNDPTATQAQRQTAIQQMKEWTQNAQKRFDKATGSERTPINSLASLSESRTLSGVSGSERMNTPLDKMVVATKEGVKLQREQNVLMDRLIKVLTPQNVQTTNGVIR